MTVTKCNKCRKVKQVYDNRQFYSINAILLCEDCLRDIKNNTPHNKKTMCVYTDHYIKEKCSAPFYFLWQSKVRNFLDVGICEHHINKGLEYFEKERKEKKERKAEQERIAEENKRKKEEEQKKRKRELFLKQQQKKLF